MAGDAPPTTSGRRRSMSGSTCGPVVRRADDLDAAVVVFG